MVKTNGRPETAEQGEYYLLKAPITALAEYAGVDIDKAVKMRVEAAVKAAPYRMDVIVRPIEPQGNLYGFASVKIGAAVMTKASGQLVPKRKGRFIDEPHRKSLFQQRR